MINELISVCPRLCRGGFIAYWNDTPLYPHDPAAMFRQAIAALLPTAGDPLVCAIRCFTPIRSPNLAPAPPGHCFSKAVISPSEPATLPDRTKSPRIIAKTKNFPINGPTQKSCAAASSKKSGQTAARGHFSRSSIQKMGTDFHPCPFYLS